jgi:hypothetical protein
MTRSSALLSVLFLAGCSFTEIPPPPESVAINQCDEDDECAGGRCRGGMCVVTSTKLDTLLVEVTPPAAALDVGGLPFYTLLDGFPRRISIGPAGVLTATIAATVPQGCRFYGPPPDRLDYGPSGGTIPASVLLMPSDRVLGIAAPTYLASTGTFTGFMVGETYRSTVNIPPGVYDLYVEPRPLPNPDPDCGVPPLLVRRQEIPLSRALAVELPPPSKFDLLVLGPAGDSSLAGWSVDVLDSVSGRVLSSALTLPAPTEGAGVSEYRVNVAFAPAHIVVDGELRVDPAFDGIEVIRLAPPEGTVAPLFLFERKGLKLSDDPSVPSTIDLSPPSSSNLGTLLPEPVAIEGQTLTLDTLEPVPAAVTLTSLEIEGTSARASYTRTIQVDETGKFSATIPPGTYVARATPPPMLGLSAAEDTWTIRAASSVQGSGLQAGKTIALPQTPFLSGDASANGSPVFGATASAVVSPLSVRTNVLEPVPPVLPRSSSDSVPSNGSFSVSVDPGLYDFFIQPEARSRYPWFVLPHLLVPGGGRSSMHCKVSLPYVYRGHVVVGDTSNVVPGALIRAYAYVTEQGEYTPDIAMSAAVVQVAEARADETGAFELLIPASLDKP